MSRIYYFCEMKMLNALSKNTAKMLFVLSKLWIL